MPTPEQHAAALDRLLEITVLLGDDMNRSVARDGLTVSRTTVLWVLRQRGPSTQRVLADAMGVTARTMTGLIDALAATGFVTREAHPTDRRATLVTVTPHGAGILDRLEREQEEFGRLLFGDLTATRFDGLVAGLDHLLARLREHLGPDVREHR